MNIFLGICIVVFCIGWVGTGFLLACDVRANWYKSLIIVAVWPLLLFCDWLTD
jgi:hypothetical protein